MKRKGNWFRRKWRIIRRHLYEYRLNARLTKCKYVHLLYNDKFAKPFVDFLNRNFPVNEHLVLCFRNMEFPFPKGRNVFEVSLIDGFRRINLNRRNVNKIICHSLYVPGIVDYLYQNPDILREKAYWLIYGGDLYQAPRDEKNDFVRKNFCGYIGEIDREYALDKYGMKDVFLSCAIPFPTLQLKCPEQTPHDVVRVQINNSCDKSTLEMLDVLQKFKNENIVVSTVLSYGDLEYRDEIIDKGRKIFGDKFEYLVSFLSPEEYVSYQAGNDILILNQRRQQGCGNMLYALKIGKKVYCRSDVTTYKYIRSVGGILFDTKKIQGMEWSSFVEMSSENREKAMKFIEINNSEEMMVQLWSVIFAYNKSQVSDGNKDGNK